MCVEGPGCCVIPSAGKSLLCVLDGVEEGSDWVVCECAVNVVKDRVEGVVLAVDAVLCFPVFDGEVVVEEGDGSVWVVAAVFYVFVGGVL